MAWIHQPNAGSFIALFLRVKITQRFALIVAQWRETYEQALLLGFGGVRLERPGDATD